jgi:hypothetical protein
MDGMWAPTSKFHHGQPTTHLSVSISLDLNNPSVNDLLFPHTKEADRSEKGESTSAEQQGRPRNLSNIPDSLKP